MTATQQPVAAQHPQRLPARPQLLLLCLGALVGAFGLSATLTGLLPASQRVEVGEWSAIAMFAAAAIPLAVIDARTRRLPNRGTFPLASAILGYWVGVAMTTGHWQLLIQAIVITIVIIAAVFLIALFSTLAAGDVKLLIAIALLTSWFSWMLPLYALLASYLLAIPQAAVVLARQRREDRDTRLPFGPYLVAATIIVVVAAKIFA